MNAGHWAQRAFKKDKPSFCATLFPFGDASVDFAAIVDEDGAGAGGAADVGRSSKRTPTAM